MGFKRICAHEVGGTAYVLAETDCDTGIVLWLKPVADTDQQTVERVAKNFATVYNCEYGCNTPYLMGK